MIKQFPVYAIIFIYVFWGCSSSEDQSHDQGKIESPPNIVLIISDDQSWSDYGFMQDPGQTSNVASRHPEVVERLSKQLDQWWKPDF